MVNIILGLVAACILVMFLTIILSDPMSLYKVIGRNPRTFRIHKPKDQAFYYLQVRVLFIYYYIEYTKYNEGYNLLFFYDKTCIKYINQIISTKKDLIYKDRYEVIKYFSDTSSPSDSLKL